MQRFLPISPGDHGLGGDLVDAARELSAGGSRTLLVREPQLDAGALRDLVTRLLPWLPELVLHDRTPGARELAVSMGLGLHLPAHVEPLEVRDQIRGRLGVSAHSREDLVSAASVGVDYALLSPDFKAGSKPSDSREPLGLEGAAQAWKGEAIPVLALGGMTPDRMRLCRDNGAWGAAGISGVFSEPTGVGVAVRSFLEVP